MSDVFIGRHAAALTTVHIGRRVTCIRLAFQGQVAEQRNPVDGSFNLHYTICSHPMGSNKSYYENKIVDVA